MDAVKCSGVPVRSHWVMNHLRVPWNTVPLSSGIFRLRKAYRFTTLSTVIVGNSLPLVGRAVSSRVSRMLCSRNRHCPKCQAGAAKTWLAAREAELLSVRYFHLVFTLPKPVADIAHQNKREIYNLLMRASADTVIKIAADPRLRTHNQNRTVAARAIADMKTFGHLS